MAKMCIRDSEVTEQFQSIIRYKQRRIPVAPKVEPALMVDGGLYSHRRIAAVEHVFYASLEFRAELVDRVDLKPWLQTTDHVEATIDVYKRQSSRSQRREPDAPGRHRHAPLPLAGA